MKTLYLDAGNLLEVRLDGPALRVRRPEQPDAHYPLPRVSRIIAIGRVRWQPDAFAACLREHKPVAVLDATGRFVRILFHRPTGQFGMDRHIGELLSVPRFYQRYELWRRSAEAVEIRDALDHTKIERSGMPASTAWHMLRMDQYRRWRLRLCRCYRYLLGLLAAHVASDLLLAGLRGHQSSWSPQEYGFLSDLVNLERWRLVTLAEQLLEPMQSPPGRWELTAAFEASAAERASRIASWRHCALAAMRGASPSAAISRCVQANSVARSFGSQRPERLVA